MTEDWKPSWLCIIPARGGSQGIPRKNLRTVGGVPLVARAVNTARAVPEFAAVVVSTDDPEIAAVAQLAGAVIHHRPGYLASSDVVVSDVVSAAMVAARNGDLEGLPEAEYSGGIAVIQPTSPFLTARTIRNALEEFTAEGCDSLATVAPDTHLAWTNDGPVYPDRANRQALAEDPRLWRETGGLVLVRTFPAEGGPLHGAPMVGGVHKLYDVHGPEALDIDTHADLAAANVHANRRSVHFTITAGHLTGSGHLRRCLALADRVSHHDVMFGFAGEHSLPVVELIEAAGYRVRPETEQVQWPDVLVIDCLEYGADLAAAAMAAGSRVLVLEAEHTPGHVVINELLPPSDGTYTGPEWAILRPDLEYLAGAPRTQREVADRVLVTFGGTDPADLTRRVGAALTGPMASGRLKVRVCQPPLVEDRPNVVADMEVVTGSMAEHFAWADLVITSQGRTMNEAAACQVPVVTIAANSRELGHRCPPGVHSVGHHLFGDPVAEVAEIVPRLLASLPEREWMAATAKAAVGQGGTDRVAEIIERMAAGAP